MENTICSDCHISKEDFCKKYKDGNSCSHYIKEYRKIISGKIIKSNKTAWYYTLVGQEVELVGEPTQYYGGLGYHVLGYIGKGILIEDLSIENKIK